LGDPAGATQALRTIDTALEACPLWHMKLHQVGCWVRLMLWRGDVVGAERWATGDPTVLKTEIPDSLPAYLREVQQILVARVQLAQGETKTALEILEHWQPHAKTAGRMTQFVEICVLKALGLQAQGDTSAALASLEQSLWLAEPEGYVQMFLEAGAPMAGLVRRAVEAGIAPGYASRLLAAFEATPEDDRQSAKDDGSPRQADLWLAEPLTPRELEVLHLIGAGYSNQQIAESLVITVNTVKKHTSGIYSKLGVHSRTQAVAQARDLGLI
jgi:LuxR family maltose regulon positive regulatory protein